MCVFLGDRTVTRRTLDSQTTLAICDVGIGRISPLISLYSSRIALISPKGLRAKPTFLFNWFSRRIIQTTDSINTQCMCAVKDAWINGYFLLLGTIFVPLLLQGLRCVCDEKKNGQRTLCSQRFRQRWKRRIVREYNSVEKDRLSDFARAFDGVERYV